MLWLSVTRWPAAVVFASPTCLTVETLAATSRFFWAWTPEHWPSMKAGPAMTRVPTSAGHHVRAAVRAAIHVIIGNSCVMVQL